LTYQLKIANPIGSSSRRLLLCSWYSNLILFEAIQEKCEVDYLSGQYIDKVHGFESITRPGQHTLQGTLLVSPPPSEKLPMVNLVRGTDI
jgi:hypothetical protein